MNMAFENTSQNWFKEKTYYFICENSAFYSYYMHINVMFTNKCLLLLACIWTFFSLKDQIRRYLVIRGSVNGTIAMAVLKSSCPESKDSIMVFSKPIVENRFICKH